MGKEEKEKQQHYSSLSHSHYLFKESNCREKRKNNTQYIHGFRVCRLGCVSFCFFFLLSVIFFFTCLSCHIPIVCAKLNESNFIEIFSHTIYSIYFFNFKSTTVSLSSFSSFTVHSNGNQNVFFLFCFPISILIPMYTYEEDRGLVIYRSWLMAAESFEFLVNT